MLGCAPDAATTQLSVRDAASGRPMRFEYRPGGKESERRLLVGMPLMWHAPKLRRTTPARQAQWQSKCIQVHLSWLQLQQGPGLHLVPAQGPDFRMWVAASGLRAGDQVQLKGDGDGGLLIRRVEGPAGEPPASDEVGITCNACRQASRNKQELRMQTREGIMLLHSCSRPVHHESAGGPVCPNALSRCCE